MRRLSVNPAVLGGAAGAVVLVLLIWYFTLWSPRNKTYNDVSAAAQSAAAQVEQLQAQVNRLKSANVPQLNNQLLMLRTAVPDQPELDQIILSINAAAQQSGVALGTISPSPPASSAPSSGGSAASGGATTANAPAHISLSITCSGGYFQVLDFVNRLDDLPRLLVVDSISMNAGGASGSGGNAATGELSVSLSARMFLTQATLTGPSGSGTGGATTTTTAPAGGGSTTTTVAGGTSASSTTTTRGATP